MKIINYHEKKNLIFRFKFLTIINKIAEIQEKLIKSKKKYTKKN